MDGPGDSSFQSAGNHNDVWDEIEDSLQAIQTHCNYLLCYYHRLPSHEVIALIEAIEIQNFLLKELFVWIAPSPPTTSSEHQEQ